MSTPFDTESVDLLNSVGVSVFKIDSGITNLKVKHAIRYLDSIMPQTKLDGIFDVGLIVEKSNK